MANGYSSDSTQRGLSYEYPHDLVRMIFVFFCIFVHLTKVTSASEGLTRTKTSTLNRQSHNEPKWHKVMAMTRGDQLNYKPGRRYRILTNIKTNLKNRDIESEPVGPELEIHDYGKRYFQEQRQLYKAAIKSNTK